MTYARGSNELIVHGLRVGDNFRARNIFAMVFFPSFYLKSAFGLRFSPDQLGDHRFPFQFLLRSALRLPIHFQRSLQPVVPRTVTHHHRKALEYPHLCQKFWQLPPRILARDQQ